MSGADWAIYSLGWGALAAVVAALCFCMWETVASYFKTKSDIVFWKGVEEGRRRIAQDAYWFSEDTPTFNAIKRLGDGEGVDGVREKWRIERQLAASVARAKDDVG